MLSTPCIAPKPVQKQRLKDHHYVDSSNMLPLFQMNVTELPSMLTTMIATEHQTVSNDYVDYAKRIETYVVPVIFAFIFIFGLLGNGTLITIFIRNKSMRSVPNTYIMSLATADLLVIAVTVPFISTIYVFDSWPYGGFVCKLSEFLRDVSIGVTVFTLTGLSAERYIAIVKPVRKHISGGSKKGTILAALGIWAVSILLASPSAYFSHVREFVGAQNASVYICYPFPENMTWYPKTAVMTRFLVFYVIPLIPIASFYALMASHLYASSQKAIGETTIVLINGKRCYSGQTKQMLERKKVAKIILTFVIIFAVCFLPHHTYMIWFHFNPNALNDYNDFWHAFKIIGFLLVFINSCINPIALYCLSAVFRKFFNRYVLCCCRRRPQQKRLSRSPLDSMALRSDKHHFQSSVINASAVSYL